MSTSYAVYDVFTPTTRARINFVPRASVNDHLVAALRTPGKQVIVYGETGSGKSTLLEKKLEELYSAHVTSRCSGSSTFEQLLLDAFDKLDPFYTAERRDELSSRGGASIGADFMRIRAGLDAQRSSTEATTSRRAVPSQLTAQRLGEFMGAAGACWVLEDFHKVPEAEKHHLSQALKIFSDLAGDFRTVRVIAVGATDTARQVVEYDAEMRHRVAEVHVPLMNDQELSSIIIGGQILLNVNFKPLREAFVRYSMGVGSVCHQLALNACLNEGIQQTEAKGFEFTGVNLEPALRRWVNESADTLKATFERALKRHKVRRYDNTRLILAALAEGPLEGMLHSEILRAIRAAEPDYPASNLTFYLRQLMEAERGSLVMSSPGGRFRFVDPLHHTYAQASLLSTRRRFTSGELFSVVVTNQLLDYTKVWNLDISKTVTVQAPNRTAKPTT